MSRDVRFPVDTKLALEVAAYRSTSPAEKLEIVFELFDLCESISSASPVRRRQIQLLDELEALEHERWREIQSRNAGRATDESREASE